MKEYTLNYRGIIIIPELRGIGFSGCSAAAMAGATTAELLCPVQEQVRQPGLHCRSCQWMVCVATFETLNPQTLNPKILLLAVHRDSGVKLLRSLIQVAIKGRKGRFLANVRVSLLL